MYKSKGYRKLGRTASQRKALLRNLTTSLLKEESIITTEAKAKELRRVTEKMITLGKKGDLAARRRAEQFIIKGVAGNDGKPIAKKLFEDIAPKYVERQGGYTRIVKLDTRRGDNAELVKIELV